MQKYSAKKRKAILLGSEKSKLPELKPYLTLISFANKGEDIYHIALYLGKYPQIINRLKLCGVGINGKRATILLETRTTLLIAILEALAIGTNTKS